MGTSTLPAPQTVIQGEPELIRRLNDDYRSKVAHVFVLYGNIHDFPDNSGRRHTLDKVLGFWYDNNIRKKVQDDGDDKDLNRGLKTKAELQEKNRSERVLAVWNHTNGLKFPHNASRTSFEEFMIAYYKEDVLNAWNENWKDPRGFAQMMGLMNKFFEAAKEVKRYNKAARDNGSSPKKELLATFLFPDADALFPDGQLGQMGEDRISIVNLRTWARDEALGERSRIILMCRSLSDIHESLRMGSMGVSTHLVPKPNLEDRETWLKNFDASMRARTKTTPHVVGQYEVKHVNLAEGFDFHQFAIQAAGMNRQQLEDVIMNSWQHNLPVDHLSVRERKQKALNDEYSGMVDFFEPDYGFELVGGHTMLKLYFERKIIKPLREGDRRRCSRGVLLTGPPGTGKTFIAKAVARESRMNFMIGKLDKLFGGLVGQTETRTRKFLEAADAAAPVIIFLDEIDSVLSSGRQSNADSGVSARVFNSVMQFLSDEARVGRIVVVAASNRPDLLDTALIRSGRFDAKLPTLPPHKGDAQGRKILLAALTKKHGIKFSKEVAATMSDPKNGLGALLLDADRVWTGAEMEVVLKDALDNAVYDGKETMSVEHWNTAFNNVIPNTEEVERMTLLSLLYVDHLGYVPTEWREQARDKKQLKQRLIELGWEEGEK